LRLDWLRRDDDFDDFDDCGVNRSVDSCATFGAGVKHGKSL
jgi:hypothetical protein